MAAELRARANNLAECVDRDFWIEDRGYYALALGGDGRPVDSVTSNAGHLAGYSKEHPLPPVAYPTSYSPQAWAAGTVPLLVRVMLGLEPDPRRRLLFKDPVLPEDIPAVRLLGVPAFGDRHDLRA